MNQNKSKAPEQESHESGIVSPIKNEILEEHSRLYPEGDPAVRRINPSREEAGVRSIRRPLTDKGSSKENSSSEDQERKKSA